MKSTVIISRVKEFLDKGDWKYSFDEENNVFTFGVALNASINSIRLLVIGEETSLLVKAVLPIGADMTNLKQAYEVMRFVCQVNYTLKNGNFEIDLNDGEIGYKCFVDCEGIEDVSLKMVENSIICPVLMLKRYLFGFEEIIFKGASAEEAYKRSEKSHLDMLMKLLSDLEDTMTPHGEHANGKHETESRQQDLLCNDCY